MKVRTKLVVFALSAALLSGGAAFAQDKPAEGHMGMTAEQMEAMQKAVAPGEMHKHLGKMAGDWTFTNKMWHAPDQPPTESSGTMHAETILDGRYVQSIWKGTMMGQPFEGRATEGFDNITKQYVSTWIDNMGTGIMYATGACEDGGKKCTSVGNMSDPMAGGSTSVRSVITWIDDNSYKNEMYMKDPASGQEMKMMEIVTKRK